MSGLDAQALLDRAVADTGLSDWGDDSFVERFGLAVKHINTIPMDAAGRQAAAANIDWLLTDRLRFFADRQRYPLADEVIDRPMFATGEPRSGTTLMHALMSVDPDARARVAASFRRWEGAIRSGLRGMQARGELGRSDPDELALATLAALQGGLMLTQMQRSTRPLETALDAMLALIAREAAA